MEGTAYYDADEAQLVELVVAPLLGEMVLLIRVCAVQKDHDGGICGVGWCDEPAAEDLENGPEDACLRR